jgi:hypothetical protein
MKKCFLAMVAFAGCFAMQNANAGWIDWSSTTTGTMDIGGTTVNVTLTGTVLDLVNGDYYYNNGTTGGTSATGTYGGLAPSDLIRLNSPTTLTINFSQAINDLDMALVSVGQNGLPVTYDFNNAVSVVSTGNNYWGYGGFTLSGDNFTGREFKGILHFDGEFSSITFSTNPSEYWHGFNFGSNELPAAVPEPTSMLLFGLGIIGLVGLQKRKA